MQFYFRQIHACKNGRKSCVQHIFFHFVFFFSSKKSKQNKYFFKDDFKSYCLPIEVFFQESVTVNSSNLENSGTGGEKNFQKIQEEATDYLHNYDI